MLTIQWLTLSSVFWGRGGVNEIEAMVKGAKAGEAQSWHCAGNKLVLGEGDSLPGSACLSE